MAVNKFFNTTVKLNDVDITNYCSVDSITLASRNLDYSQIFSKAKLKIENRIGASMPVKDDLISIDTEGNREYFRVLKVKSRRSNSEITLVSIFEDLKDKRFLLQISETPTFEANSLLTSFMYSLTGNIINNNLRTLIEMIVTLAYGSAVSIADSGKAYTYNPSTFATVEKADYFSTISINADLLLWADENNVTPSDLLKILQKIYCFSIVNDGTDFFTSHLPIMIIESDYELTRREWKDPGFFSYLGILPLLNPLSGLDKVSYSNTPAIYTERKKAVKIIDQTGTRFEYEYRKDLDLEEIVVPDNLDIQTFTTPIKFQFDGVDYTIKTGHYTAYSRYFSYIDIVQEPALELDCQISNSYKKTEYLFTNEEGQDEFTDFKNVRECSFNNADFSVSLMVDDPKMINSIRG